MAIIPIRNYKPSPMFRPSKTSEAVRKGVVGGEALGLVKRWKGYRMNRRFKTPASSQPSPRPREGQS